MLRKLAGPVLVVLVVALAGCASSGSSATSLNTAAPTAQAAGSWSGWAGMGAAAAPVSLTLTQSGSSVKGTIDVGGSPDLTGPVTGTVQGNGLSLTTQNGRTLTIMVVGESQITGMLPPGPVALQKTK